MLSTLALCIRGPIPSLENCRWRSMGLSSQSSKRIRSTMIDTECGTQQCISVGITLRRSFRCRVGRERRAFPTVYAFASRTQSPDGPSDGLDATYDGRTAPHNHLNGGPRLEHGKDHRCDGKQHQGSNVNLEVHRCPTYNSFADFSGSIEANFQCFQFFLYENRGVGGKQHPLNRVWFERACPGNVHSRIDRGRAA